jgi:molybdate transport system substrate-binding protein
MSSGIGVAVKRAPKPDIGTPDAFTDAAQRQVGDLLEKGASTIHLLGYSFNLASPMRSRWPSRPTANGSGCRRGKVELRLIVIPNTWCTGRAIGPLPKEINSIVMFTAGVSAVSPNQQAARELIKLLRSPEAKPVIQAKGNDPA